MERDIHSRHKEIFAVFDCINADLTTLNDSMQSRREKKSLLSKLGENQQKKLDEMLHHLVALENREEVREMRIALQEDLIQQLQDELVVVQGKVCRCHKCPGAAGGHMLEGLSNPSKKEEEHLEYAS